MVAAVKRPRGTTFSKIRVGRELAVSAGYQTPPGLGSVVLTQTTSAQAFTISTTANNNLAFYIPNGSDIIAFDWDTDVIFEASAAHTVALLAHDKTLGTYGISAAVHARFVAPASGSSTWQGVSGVAVDGNWCPIYAFVSGTTTGTTGKGGLRITYTVGL